MNDECLTGQIKNQPVTVRLQRTLNVVYKTLN